MRAALIVTLSLMLASLQYRLWVADGGISHTFRLRQQVDAYRAHNEALRQRNLALQAEVDDLKSGADAIEERARTMLGLVREGETFYLVLPPGDA